METELNPSASDEEESVMEIYIIKSSRAARAKLKTVIICARKEGRQRNGLIEQAHTNIERLSIARIMCVSR
jgi:hypothetical protein